MTWVIETLARGVLVTKDVDNQAAHRRYAFTTLEEAVKFVRGNNPLPSQGPRNHMYGLDADRDIDK